MIQVPGWFKILSLSDGPDNPDGPMALVAKWPCRPWRSCWPWLSRMHPGGHGGSDGSEGSDGSDGPGGGYGGHGDHDGFDCISGLTALVDLVDISFQIVPGGL